MIQKGDRVRVSVNGHSHVMTVELASPNARSLALVYDGAVILTSGVLAGGMALLRESDEAPYIAIHSGDLVTVEKL